MVYFTSDWHFSHANIMKYCNRPFENIKDMNNAIAYRFYQKVDNGDTVYFLGDIGFDKWAVESFFLTLPKDIQFHFIRGNYDKGLQDSFLKKYVTSLTQGYKDIHIKEKDRDIRITLCHFPMYSWKHSHYGAWHLYGHHHSNTQNKFYGKMMNVSVDNHDFYPVSLEEVKSFMNKKEENWNFLRKDECDKELTKN
jgi:calcineurin-like phosphoesterase family protein